MPEKPLDAHVQIPRLRKAQLKLPAASAPVARPDAEALLRRLEWTVMRRLDGLLQGDYRTLFRGFGLDLADLREYQPHDDVRHIDWNVTARLQVPHVRELQRGPRGHRLVPARPVPGRSISARARSRSAQLSTEFVAVLARLLTRHGNRVGALLYGAACNVVVPPRSGRAARAAPARSRCSDAETAPPASETDLAAIAAQGACR